MTMIEKWELASYIVTALGLPYAILLFWYESRKDRQAENEEIYQALAEEYAKFAQLLIQNADLQLMTGAVADHDLTPEQKERKKIIFDVLLALFERAHILVYEDDMDKQTKRLWATWEDYIAFWCQRSDFRHELPTLLAGEDPDFVAYIKSVAKI
jgi:hypothetical protein